jgi:hypothetical protein
MRKRPNKAEAQVPPPKAETIAGLTVSPETDIPFGKQLHMGLYEYTIYEHATEQGYYAGIAAHLKFIHDHGDDPPAMLDDEGFIAVLNAFMPEGMREHDRSMWRAHFIAGWAAVFLGLIREVKDGEAP